MKTKRFLGAAVVLLASFLAAGCTEVATDGTVSGGSANTLEISLGMNSDGIKCALLSTHFFRRFKVVKPLPCRPD
jgi:hypothetical protein